MATPRKTAAKKAPAKKAAPRKAAAKRVAPAAIDEQLKSIQADDDPDLLREEAAKLRKLSGELGGDKDLDAMAEEKEAAAKAIDGLDPDPDDVEVIEAEDIADIPEEFQFVSSADDDDREPETIPISIDGLRLELTQPAETALFMLANRIQDDQVPMRAKTAAMLDLVRLCLGPVGYGFLYERMMDPRRKFKDELIGELAEKIIVKWGSATPRNRAEKRRAARAKK